MRADGELIRAAFENLASAPSTSLQRGRFYLDTTPTLPVPKMYLGSIFTPFKMGRAQYLAVSADQTLDINHEFLAVSASSADISITLPVVGDVTGKYYKIYCATSIVTTGFKVIVKSSAAATLWTLHTTGETVEIVSNGSNWILLSRYIPSTWTAYTPTGTWSANTTYTAFWRRVGDAIDLDVLVAVSGAPTSADLAINLPSNLTIDTAKMSGATADNTALNGTVTILDSGTDKFIGLATYSTTTAIEIKKDDGDGTYSPVTQAAPMTFANGDQVSVKAYGIPITNWSG